MTRQYTVESSRPGANTIDELLCTPQIIRETTAKAKDVGGTRHQSNDYSSSYPSVDRSAKLPHTVTATTIEANRSKNFASEHY